MPRPRIAILGRFTESASALRYRGVVSSRALLEVVWAAGGDPVTLLPGDSPEALDYLFQSGQYGNDPKPVLPTVVILDLNLPKIGGLDVLERLRANERTHLVPVVIFTSSDEERDRLRCYEGRANSFVRKPLDFGEFAETVAKLGVYWVATNDPPGA